MFSLASVARTLALTAMLSALAFLGACGPTGKELGQARNAPLECLVLNLYPYRDESASEYFEALKQHIEENTQVSLNFHYIDKYNIRKFDTIEELYSDELKKALKSDSPPDLILDNFFGAVANQ